MSETATVRVARFGRPVEVPVGEGPSYSGEERSGTCSCGCSWDAHHLQLVLDKEREQSTGEYFLPGECTKCDCPNYRDTRVVVAEPDA